MLVPPFTQDEMMNPIKVQDQTSQTLAVHARVLSGLTDGPRVDLAA